jgi:hypothetical protein
MSKPLLALAALVLANVAISGGVLSLYRSGGCITKLARY